MTLHLHWRVASRHRKREMTLCGLAQDDKEKN